MLRFWLFVFAILLFPLNAFGVEEFIRGTWCTFASIADTSDYCCVPGMTAFDSSQIDWQRERDLLDELNANQINAWLMWPQAWMDSLSIDSYGNIKQYTGGDSNIDSLNIGYWLPQFTSKWREYNTNYENWTTGCSLAVDYQHSLWSGDESGVYGYYLCHEFLRCDDPMVDRYTKYACINYAAGLVDQIDANPKHYTAIIDNYCYEDEDPGNHYPDISPDFPDSVPNLDIFEFEKYPYIWYQGNPYVSGDQFQ